MGRQRAGHISAVNNVALTLGSCLAGKYQLLAQLPDDGPCLIFKAKHKLIERYYSVRLYPLAGFAGQRPPEDFQLQMQKASGLLHNAILPPVDCGVEGEWLYVVQEWPPGRSLSAELAENGALPVKRALLLIRQAAGAVAFAHDNGVVHGAIGPAAIYLCRPGKVDALEVAGEGENVRLAEFGARALFQAADRRGDVRALGMLLYSMLTGRPAYADTPASELTLPRSAPGWLSRLLSMAVNGKFEDAGAIERELDAAVDLHDMPTPVEPLPVVRAQLVPMPLVALMAATLLLGGVLFITVVTQRDGGRQRAAPVRTAEQIEQAVRNDPLAKDFSFSAEDLFRHDRFKEALDAYNVEIRHAEKAQAKPILLTGPYEHRAQCYEKLNQPEPALADWRRALQIRVEAGERSEDVAADYAHVAFCLVALGQLEQAQADFEEALKLKEACIQAGEKDGHYPDLPFLKQWIARIKALRARNPQLR